MVGKMTSSHQSNDISKHDPEAVFQENLRRVLQDDPKATPFQKQSISERLEMLRNLGYKQDKIIENEAFWAADK